MGFCKILSAITLFFIVEPFIQVPDEVALTATTGDNATLSCTADGVPTPTILWLKDGQPVVTLLGNKFIISEDTQVISLRQFIFEARLSTLRIQDLAISDNGSYSCVASNSIGRYVVQQFELTVQRGMQVSMR